MDKFTEFLTESGKGTPTYKKHPLVGHFKAVTRGTYDNMKWAKGDVGRYSSTFKDSHGFSSLYMRFKGEKTSRCIPDAVFRKHFERTGSSNIDTKKWAKAEKGGTDIEYGKRKKIKLSKDDVKSAVKKSTGKSLADKKVQKEEIEMDHLINESEVSYHYSIKQRPDGKFVIQRRAKNPEGTAVKKITKIQTLDHSYATKPEAIRKMNQLRKNPTTGLAANVKGKIQKEEVEMEHPAEDNIVENMVDCAVNQDGVKFKELFLQAIDARINDKMDANRADISEKLIKDGEDASGPEGEDDEVDTEDVEVDSPTEDEVNDDEDAA